MSNEVVVGGDTIRILVRFEPMAYFHAVLAALGGRARCGERARVAPCES